MPPSKSSSVSKALQIGITGGIGTGKSLVCKVFAQLGVPIYDADSRAKWLMNHADALKEAIRAQFGHEAYSNSGQLNRAYLASIVFGDETQIRQLNALVHPAVAEDYAQWLGTQSSPYVLKEAALMIESGSYRVLDQLIVVSAPLALRIARIRLRDPQRSEEEILGIISKQMPEEEKLTYAQVVLPNDEQQALLPLILRCHEHWLQGNIF